jgi:hypothetical protein
MRERGLELNRGSPFSMMTMSCISRRLWTVALAAFVLTAGLWAPSASAQTFRDLGQALDALTGPEPRRRPAPQGQGRDRCHDYATEMVANDQRGRQARCSGWGNHSNFDGHYQWCQRQTPARTSQALSNWRTRLQTCQFAASGSPAAQAEMRRGAGGRDPAFCQNVYGPQLTQLWAQAQQRGCRSFVRRNNNLDGHVNWCMARTRAVAERAIADNRRAVAACR